MRSRILVRNYWWPSEDNPWQWFIRPNPLAITNVFRMIVRIAPLFMVILLKPTWLKIGKVCEVFARYARLCMVQGWFQQFGLEDTCLVEKPKDRSRWFSHFYTRIGPTGIFKQTDFALRCWNMDGTNTPSISSTRSASWFKTCWRSLTAYRVIFTKILRTEFLWQQLAIEDGPSSQRIEGSFHTPTLESGMPRLNWLPH